jgi:hypothetical protein
MENFERLRLAMEKGRARVRAFYGKGHVFVPGRASGGFEENLEAGREWAKQQINK